MASNYYLGTDPQGVLGDSPQYLYMIRRTADGELFLVRSDQLRDQDSIEVNQPGNPTENFEDFEVGVDYFEGIDSDHERQYDNMKYTQYKWDDRPMFYYVDDLGQLVVKIGRGVEYESNISSDGDSPGIDPIYFQGNN